MQPADGFQRLGMPRERHPAAGEQCIAHKIKPARFRDLGIKHTYGAGGGIPRAGKALASLLVLLPVELLKSFQWHQDFAAHLEIPCQANPFAFGQIHTQRDGSDRADISRDVFPGGAVAAG